MRGFCSGRFERIWHVRSPSVKAWFGLKIVGLETHLHSSALVFNCKIELSTVLIFCLLPSFAQPGGARGAGAGLLLLLR